MDTKKLITAVVWATLIVIGYELYKTYSTPAGTGSVISSGGTTAAGSALEEIFNLAPTASQLTASQLPDAIGGVTGDAALLANSDPFDMLGI